MGRMEGEKQTQYNIILIICDGLKWCLCEVDGFGKKNIREELINWSHGGMHIMVEHHGQQGKGTFWEKWRSCDMGKLSLEWTKWMGKNEWSKRGEALWKKQSKGGKKRFGGRANTIYDWRNCIIRGGQNGKWWERGWENGKVDWLVVWMVGLMCRGCSDVVVMCWCGIEGRFGLGWVGLGWDYSNMRLKKRVRVES